MAIIRASCKSHLLRHSGKSRNPELLENYGFRVALRLPGMTIFSSFQEFCKSLNYQYFFNLYLRLIVIG